MILFEKINIGKIITNHFNTLVNDNTNKPDWDDWCTFVIIPAAFSFFMIKMGLGLGNNAITIIITALSIFVGLLFNMVVLIFDILKRDSSHALKNKILKQLLANISFTILLSIIIIGLSLFHLINNDTIKLLSDYVIYFLLCFFFLTIIMILKRMYALFDNEMIEIERKSKAAKDVASEEIK